MLEGEQLFSPGTGVGVKTFPGRGLSRLLAAPRNLGESGFPRKPGPGIGTPRSSSPPGCGRPTRPRAAQRPRAGPTTSRSRARAGAVRPGPQALAAPGRSTLIPDPAPRTHPGGWGGAGQGSSVNGSDPLGARVPLRPCVLGAGRAWERASPPAGEAGARRPAGRGRDRHACAHVRGADSREPREEGGGRRRKGGGSAAGGRGLCRGRAGRGPERRRGEPGQRGGCCARCQEESTSAASPPRGTMRSKKRFSALTRRAVSSHWRNRGHNVLTDVLSLQFLRAQQEVSWLPRSPTMCRARQRFWCFLIPGTGL